jgi:hypothetical protein
MFWLCLAIFRSQCWCRARHSSTPDRILHIRSPQKPSTLEPHPHRTSPTQTAAANQPDIQSWFSHLCKTSTLWPEDGQARPKHVVAIASINTISRQLCFWRNLLPSFNSLMDSHGLFKTDILYLFCRGMSCNKSRMSWVRNENDKTCK